MKSIKRGVSALLVFMLFVLTLSACGKKQDMTGKEMLLHKTIKAGKAVIVLKD